MHCSSSPIWFGCVSHLNSSTILMQPSTCIVYLIHQTGQDGNILNCINMRQKLITTFHNLISLLKITGDWLKSMLCCIFTYLIVHHFLIFLFPGISIPAHLRSRSRERCWWSTRFFARPVYVLWSVIQQSWG